MNRNLRETRSASMQLRRKGKLQLQYSVARQRAQSQSFQQTFQKLPKMGMKRILLKLGASTESTTLTKAPTEEQRKQYRKGKYLELKRFYARKRYNNKSKPYENDLDEVVIDCYKPGIQQNSSQIWKQYRDNYRALAFRTQKLLNTKGMTYNRQIFS